MWLLYILSLHLYVSTRLVRLCRTPLTEELLQEKKKRAGGSIVHSRGNDE
jgi:hypothetical protein